MTAKRKIRDKSGVQVFPVTHTKAVLDDNGNSVEQRLQENLDLINQKQLEVGAVPSDVTPTAGSTNWVTSGGVFNALNQKSGGDEEFVVAKAFVEFEQRVNDLEKLALEGGEDYVLAKAIGELKQAVKSKSSSSESSNSASYNGTVTYGNSDSIMVISSSYGAGNHEVAGKNWVAKISLFTDYKIVNNSFDGAKNSTHLIQFRNAGKNGNKYALAVCNENTYMSADNQVRALDNLCRTLLGMGVIPIVGTQYNTNNNLLSTAFKHYSEEHGFIFTDLRYYCNNFNSTLTKSNFDLGSHLGTRNATIMSDFYSRYIDMLPRPVKALKVFKLRPQYSVSNLDSLVFTSNEDRARMFMELNFVSWGLSDPSKVDNRPNPGSLQTNEYSSLSNGMAFSNAALISAVVPCDSHHLTKLSLSASIVGDISVYVRNVAATPYPVMTTYVRFTVMNMDVSTPSIGDVYTDGNANFSVNSIVIGENNSNYTMYCSGVFNEEDPQIGNLTKVAGTGPSSIPYELREQSTTDDESATLSDNNGHWVEIQLTKGVYDATPYISNAVDFDKIHFLVVGESFTLANPSVVYSGTELKHIQGNYREIEYNDDNPNTELLDESTFGVVGNTLSAWKDDENNFIVTEDIYEDINHHATTSCKPSGCPSIVRVSNSKAIIQDFSSKVSSSAPLSVEVWCRYFPDVYTDGSGNQITPTSYDYRNLYVQAGSVTMRKKVSTAWGKYRFSIINNSVGLRILRIFADDNIEISKVSLKYK